MSEFIVQRLVTVWERIDLDRDDVINVLANHDLGSREDLDATADDRLRQMLIDADKDCPAVRRLLSTWLVEEPVAPGENIVHTEPIEVIAQ